MSTAKADALLQRVNDRIAAGTLGDIESMTVKELRLKALDEIDRLTASDEKASITSVVVMVVVT
jgi:hypothetical protein